MFGREIHGILEHVVRRKLKGINAFKEDRLGFGGQELFIGVKRRDADSFSRGISH